MSDPTREQMQRAHALIKAGRRTEALHILQQIILVDDQNANAWWLMVHAMDTPTDRRVALDHVLKLKPGHAKARAMLAQLIAQYPELAEKPSILEAKPATRKAPVKPKPAQPSTQRRKSAAKRGRRTGNRTRLLIALGVAVLVIVVVVVVVLVTSG